jgi:hypothetical protein
VSSTPTPGTGVGVPHRNGQPQRNGHVPFIWHHHIKGTYSLFNLGMHTFSFHNLLLFRYIYFYLLLLSLLLEWEIISVKIK